MVERRVSEPVLASFLRREDARRREKRAERQREAALRVADADRGREDEPLCARGGRGVNEVDDARAVDEVAADGFEPRRDADRGDDGVGVEDRLTGVVGVEEVADDDLVRAARSELRLSVGVAGQRPDDEGRLGQRVEDVSARPTRRTGKEDATAIACHTRAWGRGSITFGNASKVRTGGGQRPRENTVESAASRGIESGGSRVARRTGSYWPQLATTRGRSPTGSTSMSSSAAPRASSAAFAEAYVEK